MITVEDVIEACQIRNRLERQTSITTMFIFDCKPLGDEGTSDVPHLYAEIYDGDKPNLGGKTCFHLILATRSTSVNCPMCNERFTARRFPAHIKKHEIRKLEITDLLHTKSKAYIQGRIDSLSKPVILPKLKIQKKKKKKKLLIFSAGAPGLGKKS